MGVSGSAVGRAVGALTPVLARVLADDVPVGDDLGSRR